MEHLQDVSRSARRKRQMNTFKEARKITFQHHLVEHNLISYSLKVNSGQLVSLSRYMYKNRRDCLLYFHHIKAH